MSGMDTNERTNIIIILADDMGYGDAGCYGSERIHTPQLDRMAAEGIRFTDFHSNGAVCSPTRAALMTGRYQQRCGIEGVITATKYRHVGMPLEQITVAQVLKKNGYRTGIFGKWHLGYDPKFSPVHFGFDEFRGFVSGNVDYQSHIDATGADDWWWNDRLRPEDGYTTDLVTDHGVRFIEENRDRPFFLYLPHACPHYPYQGPADPGYRTAENTKPGFGPREDRGSAYVEMMESMDEGIGRILDAVERSRIAERTLVVFFSDNGPTGPGSSGPLRGGKASLWEGGHRVPAVAWWPGVIDERRVTDETAIGMDLIPTALSAAGVEAPERWELDGVDLIPLLKGKESLPERALFWRHGNQKAVREGKWKLVLADGDDVEISLFNLEEDIGEERDLAGEQVDRVGDLMKKLKAWEEEVSEGVKRLT
jgi:arylsulfatase A-like enzyme